jgi:hypothetical protein
MIPTTAFDSLVQLGRRQGGLTIDDIRQALPIDDMTIEEIADMVARLEEVGIPVEIDAGLLTRPHRKTALPYDKSTPELSRHNDRATNSHTRLLSIASSIKAARDKSYKSSRPAGKFIQRSGTIVVIAAIFILFLLVLGFRQFL